jgi:hypothetical protein
MGILDAIFGGGDDDEQESRDNRDSNEDDPIVDHSDDWDDVPAKEQDS